MSERQDHKLESYFATAIQQDLPKDKIYWLDSMLIKLFDLAMALLRMLLNYPNLYKSPNKMKINNLRKRKFWQ